MSDNTVTIVIGARVNTDTGFDRVRTAVRNLGRSINENFGESGRRSGLSFTDRLRNVLAQGFASVGQAGGELGQSLGKSISSAGSSPYVIAGVATLVGALAPIIGALLGGAIVLGVGGGLAAIGIMAASKAKAVQDAFGRTKETIGKTLSEAAKPLEPVLIHAADAVSQFAKDAGPMLKQIFTDMAPVLTRFFDTMMGAFRKAAPALQPLAKAFNMIMDALSPVIADTIVKIGEALGQLGKEFQKKEAIQGFVDLIAMMLATIPAAVQVIVFLTQTFEDLWPSIKQVIDAVMELGTAVGPILLTLFKGYMDYIGFILPLIADLISFFASLISAVVDGAPKVTGALKGIVNWVGNVKGKTITLAQRGASTVIGWAKGVIGWVGNVKGKVIALAQRGASTVIGWVKSVIDWVKRFVGKTVALGVRGVSTAISAVKSLINWIKNIVGKTVDIGVNIVKKGLSALNPFAHGGNVGVGAAASGGARSALTLVGEQGPELVELPYGSRVNTTADTARMLGGAGAGGGPVVIELRSSGSEVDEFLLKILRRAINVRGGNAQIVLTGRR